METIELLGTALGLATLAGLNLYLTVFVTGLAVRMDWLHLADKYDQLAILGDPVILWVSGGLFFLEFFADKIPWVDSLWDSVHTVIRPVGGAMVAITVLGEVNPVYDVIVGLLGGSMAMTSHAAKAGTRLVANASPEPFSNIGLSLGEDVIVLAGLGVVATNPVLALVLAVVAFLGICWLLPKVFRTARSTFWFLWRRLRYALGDGDASATVERLPDDLAAELRRVEGGEAGVSWVAPAVAGRGTELKKNRFGWVLVSAGAEPKLYFAVPGRPRPTLTLIELDGGRIDHFSGLVRELVVISRADGKVKQVLQFDRSRRARIGDLLSALSGRRIDGRGAEVATSLSAGT